MNLVSAIRPMGTIDPAPFDVWAFIVLPGVIGFFTIAIAVTAIWIAYQADKRGKEGIARQMRHDFGQAFLRYARTPSAATAMEVQWPQAMFEDAAVDRIPAWFEEQRGDSRVTPGLLGMSVEMRLIEWVKSGKFRDDPIVSSNGSTISL